MFLSKRNEELASKFVSPTDDSSKDTQMGIFFVGEIAFADCHTFDTHRRYLFDQYSIAFKLLAPSQWHPSKRHTFVHQSYANCLWWWRFIFLWSIFFCQIKYVPYEAARAQAKSLSFKTIENSEMENKVLKLKNPNFKCANIIDWEKNRERSVIKHWTKIRNRNQPIDDDGNTREWTNTATNTLSCAICYFGYIIFRAKNYVK